MANDETIGTTLASSPGASLAFSELMAGLRARDGRYEGNITPDWMQGRTTFGGLAGAMCLEAVLRASPGLPPLRSAQISFLGPAGGPVQIEPKILRAGKTVTFAGAELSTEQGLATRAVFAFGAQRTSAFKHSFLPMPALPGPDGLEPYFPEVFVPSFTRHFDTRLAQGARPVSGAAAGHEHFVWARHRDPRASSLAAVLALADVPPPAMMPMFESFAPVSSMTWLANFLASKPKSRDGWWLVRFAADDASEGYSSQDMTVWNSDGEAVVSGRQSVAIFA